MNHSSEKKNGILIEKLNLKRATTKDAEEYRKHLLNEIDGGAKKIIIDLSSCEFMDSSFLGSIIAIFKKLSESGGELKLIVTQQDIRILLEITSINKFIEVYETKKEAISSFNKHDIS
jgi:anti-anti-sigma factor